MPAGNLFLFITFRVLLALLLSLVISTLVGKKIINFLRKKQIGESVRDLGLAGEKQKKGTPTMGGIIILLAILIPTLLLADLQKAYVRLMIFATVWMGIIGFIDDYLKLRAKKIALAQGIPYKKGDKDGLAGWFKIMGQVVLGFVVAITLLYNYNTRVYREYTGDKPPIESDFINVPWDKGTRIFVQVKDTPITTIPFVKTHEFNYSKLLPKALRAGTWLLYIVVVIFIITAVSNGANITDGLDGLATGTSAIIGTCLAVFAYASGNLRVADYLNIMYIPNPGELSVFIGAMVELVLDLMVQLLSCAGVHGDTGSLSLGGIIAPGHHCEKELLIPIFCGVFLVENLSVMIQVTFFKYTKRKYGEGRRIFLMSSFCIIITRN